MLHSNLRQTDFIGTHESVYGDSPIGNLEGFIGQDILPLQQGFYGDVLTCISVLQQDSAFHALTKSISALRFINITLGFLPPLKGWVSAEVS